MGSAKGETWGGLILAEHLAQTLTAHFAHESLDRSQRAPWGKPPYPHNHIFNH